MPTSLEEAALHLRQQTEQRAARATERAARLRSRLPEAKRVLHGHGAERILLFGSLATGRFSEQSDVDLAVENLPGSKYFTALADLMALFGAPVDLVRLEEAPPELRERIWAEGAEL